MVLLRYIVVLVWRRNDSTPTVTNSRNSSIRCGGGGETRDLCTSRSKRESSFDSGWPEKTGLKPKCRTRFGIKSDAGCEFTGVGNGG